MVNAKRLLIGRPPLFLPGDGDGRKACRTSRPFMALTRTVNCRSGRPKGSLCHGRRANPLSTTGFRERDNRYLSRIAYGEWVQDFAVVIEDDVDIRGYLFRIHLPQ